MSITKKVDTLSTKVDSNKKSDSYLDKKCNKNYFFKCKVIFMTVMRFFMVLTKQSSSGRFVVVADLSIPALEVRHLLHDDVYEVVCRYVGNPNYNSTSFVKRMFKNIELF